MWKLSKSERTGLLAFSAIIAAVCIAVLLFRQYPATTPLQSDSIRCQMEKFRTEIRQQFRDTIPRHQNEKKKPETQSLDINPLDHPLERKQP